MDTKKNLITISERKCALGEGPVWHQDRGSWLWVDILSKTLFELPHQDLLNGKTPVAFALDKFCSSMVVTEDNQLVLATESTVDLFNLGINKQQTLLQLPFSRVFRSNDGGMGPDNKFWFSSMEWEPSGLNGGLYSIDSKLRLTREFQGIGIPNTMVWHEAEKRFYVSDSYRRTIFRFDLAIGTRSLVDATAIFDFPGSDSTPDGGALDEQGNVWVALWGGGRVVCISPSGNILSQIEVPVLQPTSCCFGGPEGRHLFITSAYEGLSREQLQQYPLSGSAFCVELKVSGALIPKFSLEG